ncbi:MAG: hypothetical protein KIT84_18115 [Labilithrix sp.]|nr:hypothetical protein [Labilithrix sp.]MCW5812949.1 hypothetical protein [Labilithrix sp.]
MFRATHAIVSFLCCSAIVILGAGCGEDEKATPQVVFSGDVQQATGKDCRDSGPLFEVGEFGNPGANLPSKPVKDGEAAGQGTVSIACSVVPSGTDEFAVDATVNLSGATGGLFKLEGKFKTTGEQTDLRVIASAKRSANGYDQRDRGCIARYTDGMGVAAGRVWAEIDCPNAINTSDDNRACRVTAQFRFENCAQ